MKNSQGFGEQRIIHAMAWGVKTVVVTRPPEDVPSGAAGKKGGICLHVV